MWIYICQQKGALLLVFLVPWFYIGNKCHKSNMSSQQWKILTLNTIYKSTIVQSNVNSHDSVSATQRFSISTDCQLNDANNHSLEQKS